MTIADKANQILRRLPVWPLYVLGTAPVVWVYWQGLTGGLGVDPVKEIEHQLGLWALWLMMASLCVTPLRRFFCLNLMRFRRALGLLAFYYVLAHLLTWAILDVQSLSAVGKDILKRPYITIGMVGFTLLLPLALTSTDWAIRRLGAARWRQLHKLAYGAVGLGAVHFVMLVKGWQLEPLLYLAAVVGLLLLRCPFKWGRRATRARVA